MSEDKIIITYETLFEILRRERDKDELQKLNDSFFSDVGAYIDQKKGGDLTNPFSRTDGQKNAIQLVNARKLIKDLYDRREKKIIDMAVIRARTNSTIINTATLLESEKELFNKLGLILENARKSALEGVLAIDYHNKPIFAYPAQYESIPRQSEVPKEHEIKPLEPKELKKDDNSVDIGSKNIEFLHAVPKFMGPSLEVYGPYNPNERVMLPTRVADILIKKGKAKDV